MRLRCWVFHPDVQKPAISSRALPGNRPRSSNTGNLPGLFTPRTPPQQVSVKPSPPLARYRLIMSTSSFCSCRVREVVNNELLALFSSPDNGCCCNAGVAFTGPAGDGVRQPAASGYDLRAPPGGPLLRVQGGSFRTKPPLRPSPAHSQPSFLLCCPSLQMCDLLVMTDVPLPTPDPHLKPEVPGKCQE